MKRTLSLLAAGVLALGFIGCGGDDDASARDTTTTTEGSTTTTEGSTTTTDGDATTTTDGGGSSDVEVNDDTCSHLQELEDLDPGDGSDPTPEQIDQLIDLVNQLIDDAPDEVSSAASTFLDFIEAVQQEAESSGDDFDTASDTVFGNMSDDDSDAFLEASQTINDAEEACGIDTGSSDSGDGSSDATLGDPQEVPDGITDSDELSDANDCFDGDLAACDSLFQETDIGSIGETYGSTCGGRLSESDQVRGSCVSNFGDSG